VPEHDRHDQNDRGEREGFEEQLGDMVAGLGTILIDPSEGDMGVPGWLEKGGALSVRFLTPSASVTCRKPEYWTWMSISK
jgi:hypothetical protein